MFHLEKINKKWQTIKFENYSYLTVFINMLFVLQEVCQNTPWHLSEEWHKS
jgi:hypothetical protein